MKNDNVLYLSVISDEAGKTEEKAFCDFAEKLGEYLFTNVGISLMRADVGSLADGSRRAVFSFGADMDEVVEEAAGRELAAVGAFRVKDRAEAAIALIAAVEKAFPYVTVEAGGGKLIVCGQECEVLDEMAEKWLKTCPEAAPALKEIATADEQLAATEYSDVVKHALALREKKAALAKIDAILEAAFEAEEERWFDQQYGDDIMTYRNAIISTEKARLAIKTGEQADKESVEAVEKYYRKLLEIDFKGYVRAYMESLVTIADAYNKAGRKDEALPCLIRYALVRAEGFLNCPGISFPAALDVALTTCALRTEASDGVCDKLSEILSVYEQLSEKSGERFDIEKAQALLVSGVFVKEMSKESAVGYLEKCIDIVMENADCEIAEGRIFSAAGTELAELYMQNGRNEDAEKIAFTMISLHDLIYQDPEEYLGEYLKETIFYLKCDEIIDELDKEIIKGALSVAEAVYNIDRDRHAETLAEFYTGLSRCYYDIAMDMDDALWDEAEKLLETSEEYKEKARRVRARR